MADGGTRNGAPERTRSSDRRDIAVPRAGSPVRGRVDVSCLLPLTEPVFHILLALSDQELHGYGIILAVEEVTSGKVRLKTGTLYAAIRRLVEEGLIEEIQPDIPADEDRRRVYRLTGFGRAVARAESRRVASLTALARRRGLLARGARPRF